ncbi:MAG: putative Histidine kinase protein [Anaerolineales bacterium]|nr:putative Histidine kinase protein [Anaerolineales bacterium]
MSALLDLRRIAREGAHWAFVLTVSAALAPTFYAFGDQLGWPQNALLLGMGLAYIVIGIVVFEFCTRRRQRFISLLYFAVQIPLAVAIFYLGLGHLSGLLIIIVLPLVSHAQMLFSNRGALVIAALITAVSASTIGFLTNWTALFTSALSIGAGVVFVFVFTQVALREQQARAEVERLAADLRAANDKLREYAVQVEELATAKERNRLAREIHDSLGHYLTVINVQIEAARAVIGNDPPRALDALRKAQSLAQEGLADVRRSVAALRASPTEDRPLPEALAALAAENRASGLLTELAVTGAPRPLPPQTELTLYRAMQEGLTNIRKHARAARVDITLDYGDNERVRLVVRDNGVGDSPDGRGSGYGLLGVRERTHLLGGEVRIRSAEGQGFTLEVELPG